MVIEPLEAMNRIGVLRRYGMPWGRKIGAQGPHSARFGQVAYAVIKPKISTLSQKFDRRHDMMSSSYIHAYSSVLGCSCR